MPNSIDPKSAVKPDKHSEIGTAGWPLALLGFVLAALLAWQSSHHAQRNWSSPQRWDVVLEGQHYQLGGTQLQWLGDFSTRHFAMGSEQARGLLQSEVNAQLDVAFAEVSARLPDFADWYYSLGGEYSRISMALLGYVNVVDDGYVARRAASILFPEPGWEEALISLDSNASQLLLQQQAHSQAAWLQELQRRLSANRVPAPVAPSNDNTVLLDGLVAQLQGWQQPAMLEARLTLSTVGAAAVAGPALWRAVSTRAALATTGAAGTARAAASRGVATRGAAKVATRGAAGAAASAGAVCLPGGAIAVACAAVAAAGTWIATDWLLLQVDEALNRDEMLAGLEAGLAALRLELEAALLQAYDQRIDAWQEAANVQIEKTFSPRQAR